MKKWFFIYPVVLFSIFFQINVLSSQEINGLEPPPVNIELSTLDVAAVDSIIEVKLVISPQKNLNLQAEVYIPEGIEPIKGNYPIISCRENRDFMNDQIFKKKIKIFIGIIDEIKTYSFRLKVNEAGDYKLIANVKALAIGGEKQTTLEIKANR